MFRAISFDHESRQIKDFIDLPKTLYSKKYMTANETIERQLLLGKHPLSKYFKLKKHVVYDEADNPVARFILTEYKNDENLYFGFFESIDDDGVAKLVFDTVLAYAKKHKYKKIVGPLNASFWLGYRLKIDNFNKRSYFLEPYNKPYYLRLFQDNGYKVSDRYTSDFFSRNPIHESKRNKTKFVKNYAKFSSAGYTINNVSPATFNKSLREIYEMFSELYSNFPTYKPIDWVDFKKLFDNLKPLLDFKLVKIAYYDNRPVGFVVAFPNHYNLISNLTPINKLRIALKRIRSKSHVIMYMGVRRGHEGLGRAMMKPIIKQMYLQVSSVIGALIHEGTPTSEYMKEAVNDKYHYALLERIAE